MNEITLQLIGEWANRLENLSDEITDKLEFENDTELKLSLSELTDKLDSLVDQFDNLACLDVFESRNC